MLYVLWGQRPYESGDNASYQLLNETAVFICTVCLLAFTAYSNIVTESARDVMGWAYVAFIIQICAYSIIFMLNSLWKGCRYNYRKQRYLNSQSKLNSVYVAETTGKPITVKTRQASKYHDNKGSVVDNPGYVLTQGGEEAPERFLEDIKEEDAENNPLSSRKVSIEPIA